MQEGLFLVEGGFYFLVKIFSHEEEGRRFIKSVGYLF